MNQQITKTREGTYYGKVPKGRSIFIRARHWLLLKLAGDLVVIINANIKGAVIPDVPHRQNGLIVNNHFLMG